MSVSSGEFYGDAHFVEGPGFDYFETSRPALESGRAEPREVDQAFLDRAEVTQAFSMGVARQDFRDRTTLRASGQDFTPTTYSYLGKLGELITHHRKRGALPPPETNLLSSRIDSPEPIRVDQIRGRARASVAGALDPAEADPADLPYVRGPEEAGLGQVYRTSRRALYDRHHEDVDMVLEDGSVVDLTLSFQQEAAAQRLIEAWQDHCDHDRDEHVLTRNRRRLMGAAIAAGSMLVSSGVAWAIYEHVVNR
jgi:hypothetical protein